MADQTTGPIRIGAVPYLNARVLTYGLEPNTAEYTLEHHVPSTLAARFRDGDLDVALVSSIEYFRNPDCVILPGISISGGREMWSVKLFHRPPVNQLRRVALDPASQSANALLSVLLRERFKVQAELVAPEAGEDPAARKDLDGFLLIGDPCLAFEPGPWRALDLAAEWRAFTHLPFVFALWLARRGADLRGVNGRLMQAKHAGLRNVEEIAEQHRAASRLDLRRARQYLTHVLRYELGPQEQGGLDLFQRYLLRHKLVQNSRPLEFYSD